jgi:phosphoglycolate phosphatase
VNRLALFDCDGTLVDSQHNICLCMEDAFTRASLIAPSRSDIRRVVGLSLFQAVQMLIPDESEARIAQVAEDYKNAFHRLRGNGLVAAFNITVSGSVSSRSRRQTATPPSRILL